MGAADVNGLTGGHWKRREEGRDEGDGEGVAGRRESGLSAVSVSVRKSDYVVREGLLGDGWVAIDQKW